MKEKKSTNNIHQYINKIPYDIKKLSRPSEAKCFVDEEMALYPISRKTKSAPKVSKKINADQPKADVFAQVGCWT